MQRFRATLGATVAWHALRDQEPEFIRFLERAIAYEVPPSIEVNEDGARVQETRLTTLDATKPDQCARKEDAHDYRYFPDPDCCRWRSRKPGWAKSKAHCPSSRRTKRER